MLTDKHVAVNQQELQVGLQRASSAHFLHYRTLECANVLKTCGGTYREEVIDFFKECAGLKRSHAFRENCVKEDKVIESTNRLAALASANNFGAAAPGVWSNSSFE